MDYSTDYTYSIRRSVFELFVATGCWGGDTVATKTQSLRDRDLPDLHINVLELARSESIPPKNVFVVSTNRSNGKAISFRSPEESEILDQLVGHLSELRPYSMDSA